MIKRIRDNLGLGFTTLTLIGTLLQYACRDSKDGSQFTPRETHFKDTDGNGLYDTRFDLEFKLGSPAPLTHGSHPVSETFVTDKGDTAKMNRDYVTKMFGKDVRLVLHNADGTTESYIGGKNVN